MYEFKINRLSSQVPQWDLDSAAKELASQGANLTLVDFNEKSLTDAVKSITRNFLGEIVSVIGDASKEEDGSKIRGSGREKIGRIDGLYNNAGIEGRQSPMTEYDIAVFRKVLDVNVLEFTWNAFYVIPVMQSKVWPNC